MPTTAESAGTKLPTCAMKIINATYECCREGKLEGVVPILPLEMSLNVNFLHIYLLQINTLARAVWAGEDGNTVLHTRTFYL